jgi:hypothetical protein
VNLLEPWILLRLLAGLSATLLFVRGAITSLRVIRHFDVRRAIEGQLALERQAELGSTFVRVGAVIQIGALVLSVLTADRLSHSVRGAMCAYGVFHENPLGFPAVGLTAGVALVAGIAVQLCTFDRSVRGLDLVRPIAVLSLLMAPLAVADFALTSAFFLRLDLGVVASCCSVQLDVGALTRGGFASGPREVAATSAVISASLAAIVGWAASIRARVPFVVLAATLSLIAVPLAVGAIVLEVAPHAFELPQHACPFCLLRADVLGIGYPLFGSIFLAVVWSAGAAAAGLVAGGDGRVEPFVTFARTRLRRGSLAWLVALFFGVGPVLRYGIVSAGRSLFP